MGPPLYLAGVLVAGYGLTLLGPAMEAEERLFFGAVAGSMAVTLAAFLACLALGFGPGSVLAGLGLAGGASAAGWWTAHGRLLPELKEAASRWLRWPRGNGHPWPLLLVLVVSWGYSVRLLLQAYRESGAGLTAGYVNIWGDWAAHLTYAGSFAFGRNLPPQFPIDPGHHLSYPFLIDFMAATLVPLGASLTSSLVWTSGLLGLAFPGVMYLAARRLLGGRAAPAVSVLLFAASGGLGFLLWFQDLQRTGLPAAVHMPRPYTSDAAANLQWLDPVLAYLLPQRDVLFGLSVVLIAAALLWRARGGACRRPYVFAGVLVGLTPLFHVHGYGTAVALFAFWALIERSRAWAWFFVPALALGVPALAWLLPGIQADLRWQVGWMAGTGPHPQPWPLFWFQNTGLLIPLFALGSLWPGVLPGGLRLRLAPLWLWFAVPNLAVFQPWDWDNTKYFLFWLLFGSMVVAAVVVRISRAGWWGTAAAAACCGVLCLAGALDLARAVDYQVSAIPFIDPAGLELAAWARSHTDPRAVFLAAPVHNEPVPALAGRRVVLGYPGWVWSYGLPDLDARYAAVTSMLEGSSSTPALLRRYHVRYVVLGPAELSAYHADAAYWRAHGRQVYSAGGYSVYRVGPG
ncbi:MAG: hypothetical protein ACREPI_09530 [Candidatus Dormibacterales bacterium]